jgi:DNA-binding LacI/PurR family transcriptional regulator
MTLDQLKEFFDRKGINAKGICEEGGFSQQYLYRVLNDDCRITPAFEKKAKKVMRRYGYKFPRAEQNVKK